MNRALLAAALCSTALPAVAEEVNIYSHRQPELIQPLLDAFTKETGITTNIAFVDKGMAERLQAEGDRSPADIVLTVDIARLKQIVDAGVVQPVQSDVLEANIPEAFRDSADQWFGLTARARIVYAHKERVADGAVTTYEDLADPKWKGKICTRSGTNDYNVALLSAVIAHHGVDAATTWAEGLKANLARKPDGGDRDQVKAIWGWRMRHLDRQHLLHGPDAERPRAESLGRIGPHRVPDLRERWHPHEYLGRRDDQIGPEQGCRTQADGVAVVG